MHGGFFDDIEVDQVLPQVIEPVTRLRIIE